jgi:hypothetical protein
MTTLRLDRKTPMTWEGSLDAGRAFFVWWRDRLCEVLPKPFRDRVLATFGRWTLEMESGVWRLRGPGDGEELLLDPALPDEELAERIARFANASRERRVEVTIPPECALVTGVRLAAVARAQFKRAIGLQLGRLSPLRAEDVRFDCRCVGEDAGEIDVEVGIVPKQTLAAFEQRLARLGLAVGRFRVAGQPFRFEPADPRRTASERLRYALGATAIAMFAAAICLAPVLRSAELDDLSREVRRLQPQAQRAAALRDKLRREAAPVAAVNAALSQPSALDILQRLTETMPADAQLADLRIDAASVRIAGSCGHAAQLVALLRRSGAFRHVALIGPAGKAPDGRERFEIGMSAQ